MNVYGTEPDNFAFPEACENFLCFVNIDAEFCFAYPRNGVFMRVIFDIGIDSKGRLWRIFFRCCIFFGNCRKVFELVLRFDIEAADSAIECLGNFLVGFSDSCEDGLREVAAGMFYTK